MKKPYLPYPTVSVTRALALCLLAGCLSFCNCKTAPPTASKVKACLLIVNYPIVVTEKEGTNMYNLLDTIAIFSFNEYKIYKLAKVHLLETDEPIPGSEPFFVFKKGEQFGMLFKTFNDQTFRKLPIDSILRNNGYAGISFRPDPGLRLTASSSYANNDVVEKYVTVPAAGPNTADSVYFYYSNAYRDIDYTFSSTLDSLRNMKLYKARLIFNEKKQDSTSLVIPKREIFFEMQPTSAIDHSALANLIRNYERFNN